MNKWHDLRKDPTDLPKEMDEYWVMIDGCPHVESDSFDPSAIGREISSPVCKNGEIVGYETYTQSGWWENSKPGLVTHWMVMEKPPKPEPPNDNLLDLNAEFDDDDLKYMATDIYGDNVFAIYEVHIDELRNKVDQLPDREKKILSLYYHEDKTLEAIGQIFGVTRERIRQIKMLALRRLRHPKVAHTVLLSISK